MMALAGLGAALTMVSTYGRAHSAALRLGYKDNICTYLLVSSKLIFSLTMISPKKTPLNFSHRYVVQFVFPGKFFRTHRGGFHRWALWFSSNYFWLCYCLRLSTFNGLIWTYYNCQPKKEIDMPEIFTSRNAECEECFGVYYKQSKVQTNPFCLYNSEVWESFMCRYFIHFLFEKRSISKVLKLIESIDNSWKLSIEESSIPLEPTFVKILIGKILSLPKV